jgi:pimeloyl-ACP methyl ester carboxylesterase
VKAETRKLLAGCALIVALVAVAMLFFRAGLANNRSPALPLEQAMQPYTDMFLKPGCQLRKASLAFTAAKDLHGGSDVCSVSDRGELGLIWGIHHGGRGALPVMAVVPRNKRVRGVLVYLVGGPGDILLSQLTMSPGDEVTLSVARGGYAVVYLGYYGTNFGSLFPQSDLFPAAEQVAHYIRMLKGRSNFPVAIAGVSAGASVGYLASRSFHDVPVLLLSPPLASVRELVTTGGLSVSDPNTPVVVRQRRLGDRLAAPPVAIKTVRQYRMSAFFGETYAHPLSELLTRYPTQSRIRPLLIVGNKDSRIGLDHLPAFRRNAPHVTVKVIKGFGHGPSNHKQARKLAAAIKRHMARQQRKGRPIAGAAFSEFLLEVILRDEGPARSGLGARIVVTPSACPPDRPLGVTPSAPARASWPFPRCSRAASRGCPCRGEGPCWTALP